MEIYELITFILNLIIIITCLILIIIYICNKSLHFYIFYCNLILLIILLLNNSLRIIIKQDKFLMFKKKIPTYICYGQAFLLSFLDKLMLCTLTMSSFLISFGTTKNKFYKLYEKSFFYFFLCLSLFVSSILSALYLIKGDDLIENSDEDYYYPIIEDYNKTIDFSFVSFLLCFNFYLLLNIPFYLSEKMKTKIFGEKNIINYNNAFIIIIFMFLINGFLYIISLLKIHDYLFFNKKYFDLCYASISLIIEIFYSINKKVARGLLCLINCCNTKNNNDKNSKEKDSDTRMTLTGSEGIISDISLSA